MEEIKHTAGEFSIESFELINQHGDSIRMDGIVREFILYESIFNKFCSGTLGITDGLNFPKNFRLTGQEFVRISIRQSESLSEDTAANPVGAEDRTNIDKMFRIFKIEKVQQANQSTQNYVIKLCDPRLFAARRNRVSRVFRGEYREIIKKILVEEAGIPEFEFEFDSWEKTEPNTIQFISPNWTVGTLIDYCVNNADLGEESVYRNGMFFYQTLIGGFEFKSIDAMFQDEIENFTCSNKPQTSVSDSETDEQYKHSQILGITKPQLFDTLSGTVSGAYASKRITYDPIYQITEEEIFDLEETWNRGGEKHLSTHPLIHLDSERVMEFEDSVACVDPASIPTDEQLPPNKFPDSFITYGNTMIHSYDDNLYPLPEVFKASSETNKLERRAMLELLNQHRIVVTLPLRTDLCVGKIITLEIGQLDGGSIKQEDPFNDNRYLITDIAIKGIPDRNYGTMDIECVKESFAQAMAEVDPLKIAMDTTSIMSQTTEMVA